MTKILLAEDELAMQKIIKLYLEKEGYKVTVVGDGEAALEALYKEQYDLVILDWMMPKCSGIEVCETIQKLGIQTKIIILTAKSEAEDEIRGLSVGAHDYVTKPFEPRVLLLRIQKLIKIEEVLKCGNLMFYPQKGGAKRGEKWISLSKIEQNLLRCLILNKGIVLSREKLLNQVWGMDYEGEVRTVDTHIRRLRVKIGEDLIGTHRGLGYFMRETYE